MAMAKSQLPDLRTREEIQSYLHGVAKEVGMAINSPEVALELDRKDQLAGFRGKFEVPTIGQLLEEHERAAGEEVLALDESWGNYAKKGWGMT